MGGFITITCSACFFHYSVQSELDSIVKLPSNFSSLTFSLTSVFAEMEPKPVCKYDTESAKVARIKHAGLLL